MIGHMDTVFDPGTAAERPFAIDADGIARGPGVTDMKSGLLAGLYAATLAIFVGDESAAKAETLAFLDRRIEGVMRFEKAKAKLLRPDTERFSVARFLGRLRYPAA